MLPQAITDNYLNGIFDYLNNCYSQRQKRLFAQSGGVHGSQNGEIVPVNEEFLKDVEKHRDGIDSADDFRRGFAAYIGQILHREGKLRPILFNELPLVYQTMITKYLAEQ